MHFGTSQAVKQTLEQLSRTQWSTIRFRMHIENGHFRWQSNRITSKLSSCEFAKRSNDKIKVRSEKEYSLLETIYIKQVGKQGFLDTLGCDELWSVRVRIILQYRINDPQLFQNSKELKLAKDTTMGHIQMAQAAMEVAGGLKCCLAIQKAPQKGILRWKIRNISDVIS